MKNIFSLIVFTLVIFAGQIGFARSPHPEDTLPPRDTLITAIASTDLDLEQDSTEASSDVMVPFRSELVKAAHRHHVPAALLAAFCQEESQFNPWAERSEPAYLRNKKIRRASTSWSRQHNGLPTTQTEQSDRSRSMGLMQPMGEVAREQGFDDQYLSSLFVPFNSIDQGAILLKKLLVRYHNDTLAAISAYNQGNNRKKNGAFVNARYVYRVAVAWRHYSTILKYSNHVQSSRLQMATNRSGSDTSLTRTQTDTSKANSGHSPKPNDNDQNGRGSKPTGYGVGTRHSSSEVLPGGQSQHGPQTSDRRSIGGGAGWLAESDRIEIISTIFLGLCFIGSMFGLAYSVYRFERNWSGHSKRLPRPPERHVLGIAGHGRAPKNDRASILS